MANCITHPVPPAWYELVAHLSGARAVSSIIIDYLPCGETAKPLLGQIDHLGNLVSAVSDLLDLVHADTEALYADPHARDAERQAI